MTYHIATANYAVAKYAYEDPAFSGFVDNLDRINALADAAPGFVWRYISDDDDAEARRIYGIDDLIFNMSVWESVESLRNYVYESDHVDILRRRAEWFVPQPGATMALWWKPAGEIPTISEAKHRMECLTMHGPTEDAFTFRSVFEPPASKAVGQ